MIRKTLTIFCLKCGYDLRASKDNCPECGLPFDPDDPNTYFPDARPRRSGLPFLVAALVGGGSVLLGIMSIGSDFDALGRVLLLGGLLIEVGILLVGSAILVLKRESIASSYFDHTWVTLLS